MSGGPDDALIAGEQDALVPVDAGLPHLDYQEVGSLPEECLEVHWLKLWLQSSDVARSSLTFLTGEGESWHAAPCSVS